MTIPKVKKAIIECQFSQLDKATMYASSVIPNQNTLFPTTETKAEIWPLLGERRTRTVPKSEELTKMIIFYMLLQDVLKHVHKHTAHLCQYISSVTYAAVLAFTIISEKSCI